jgi:predicted TIM-barrel fold metal-dependent hydrolase
MTGLFDSLTHPTLSGRWPNNRDARVETLVASLRNHGFARACAVGLAGIEGYAHAAFAAMCRPYPELVPIAGVDPQVEDLAAQLDIVAALGFCGIKVHPRNAGITLADPSFARVFREAAARDLVVFLCTYFHTDVRAYPCQDPLYDLVRALQNGDGCRLVLIHGGDVELMRYAQLARHSPNLLLDVSHTMMKYQGSSVDIDLKFLFRHFESRICIGTDYPDYGHSGVRARFDELSDGLNEEKKAAIGRTNLENFLGLTAWNHAP